jgi:hypothetical protein
MIAEYEYNYQGKYRYYHKVPVISEPVAMRPSLREA